MYVCVHEKEHQPMYVCICICAYVHKCVVHALMYRRTYRIRLGMDVCIYLCMDVCYVCLHVCLYVHTLLG